MQAAIDVSSVDGVLASPGKPGVPQPLQVETFLAAWPRYRRVPSRAETVCGFKLEEYERSCDGRRAQGG
jgi:hypothetical protein